MSDNTKSIWVVAHDGGCEGHSLPYLVFTSKADAFAWKRGQNEAFSVVEVPVYPAFPAAEWYSLESATE